MAPLSPDASLCINNPEFFREAILTIMLRNGLTSGGVAKRMGVDTQRITRYLRRNVKGTHTHKAMTHRYPEQFLIELMLDEDDRVRLLKQHVWRA